VFVHGLGGDKETWTSTLAKEESSILIKEEASINSVFWPKDLLVVDVPKARILTFGYDADVDHFWGPSQNEINGHAHKLIDSLIGLRHRTGTVRRHPSIFYSLRR
jgi:protein SERAC1